MVNIDTVYQRVLSLANKEQRGYITPQEFNLFANQVQMEIFEQYFYDINQFRRAPSNDTDYSDMIKMLEEKISIFETTFIFGAGLFYSNGVSMPDNFYRLGTVMVKTAKNGTSWARVEMLSRKEFDLAQYMPLTQPTPERPVMYRNNDGITIVRAMDGETPLIAAIISQVAERTPPYTGIANYDTNLQYIRIPHRAIWGYVVVNEKSLYNADISTNFDLHPSDETELVYRILKLAGITLNKAEVVQVGQALETQQHQQEKQ